MRFLFVFVLAGVMNVSIYLVFCAGCLGIFVDHRSVAVVIMVFVGISGGVGGTPWCD